MFLFSLCIGCGMSEFSCFFTYSTYNSPKLITALQGKEVVNISCGSAHSCSITRDGQLYTWGKGTYGRLGHGDREQL